MGGWEEKGGGGMMRVKGIKEIKEVEVRWMLGSGIVWGVNGVEGRGGDELGESVDSKGMLVWDLVIILDLCRWVEVDIFDYSGKKRRRGGKRNKRRKGGE